MKNVKPCLASLALFAAITGTANAQYKFVFDENGNGVLTFASGLTQLDPGYLAPDPTGGVALPVLTYDLPLAGFQMGIGDVAFLEPGGSTYQVSDVFRFFNDANGNGHLIFYSDNYDGVDSLADIAGLPKQLGYGGVAPIFLTETGKEGGVQWCNYAAGGNFVYQGLSDTPEPAPIAILGIGMLALMRRHRPNKK